MSELQPLLMDVAAEYRECRLSGASVRESVDSIVKHLDTNADAVARDIVKRAPEFCDTCREVRW